MQIKVGRMPGRPRPIQVEEGITAAEALGACGHELTSGLEIRINGEPAQADQQVSDGDRVFLVAAVKGN